MKMRIGLNWLIGNRRCWGVAICGMLLLPLVLGAGCKPVRFFERNACDILNCDTLFFLDDMFPLAGGPTGGGGTSGADGTTGAAGTADSEEEDGGHLH